MQQLAPLTSKETKLHKRIESVVADYSTESVRMALIRREVSTYIRAKLTQFISAHNVSREEALGSAMFAKFLDEGIV